MFIYQVRRFDGQNWHVITSYATEIEAYDFSTRLSCEWDIKKVTLAEANA